MTAQKPQKVVFFNGPPFSGKDTALKLLPSFKRFSFADDLKDRFEKAFDYYERPEGPDKDLPMSGPFASRTYRQGLIGFAEDFMKKLWGQDIFGRILLEEMKHDRNPVFGISDSGFDYEALPIVRHYGVENCAIVQLKRHNCTFVGDSRGYWGIEDVAMFYAFNDGTPEGYRATLEPVLQWAFPCP